MYNGKFKQVLSIVINGNDHEHTLNLSKIIKKQCEAWFFNVEYKEHKSARKGKILNKEILISQTAYASDILIFKEAIRRICFHINDEDNVKFIDRGTEPLNDLRETH
tara:strand:- start:30041 stop:30361 length:321 start_codon:yes stop_codon:yes gene_type:complete